MTIDGGHSGHADSRQTRAHELLAYLLLHRERAHPREKLAGLLWRYGSTTRSKANLRKTLWQIQQLTEPFDAVVDTPMVAVDGDWVQVNSESGFWLDVACFEHAYETVRDEPIAELSSDQVDVVRTAVELYTADLLENWYCDWCLIERERLQIISLMLLRKLVGWCEHHGSYEAGIAYCNSILRVDYACESTHRCLMRLRYKTGDRTGALRQYQRCEEALTAELDVAPSTRTQDLHRQIRDDRLETTTEPRLARGGGVERRLDHIRRLQEKLRGLQGQIRKEIARVELTVNRTE